ncbi:MAG TPA: hypothetical protein VMT20_16830 [Terriglobia bacterium]|nr:hypothetical protein [Terriglobia bacterium]
MTQYDLSGAQLTRFEIRPKDKSINLRLLRSFTRPSANAPHAGSALSAFHSPDA